MLDDVRLADTTTTVRPHQIDIDKTDKRMNDSCDDESDLPEHTVSMRAALRRCAELIHKLNNEERSQRFAVEVRRQIVDSVATLKASRQDAYVAFWERLHNLDESESPIPIISVLEDMSPSKFRQDFQLPNLPCLIQFEELPPHKNPFAFINEEWRGKDGHHINYRWFLDQVGAETLVPLRYNPIGGDERLDSEGRATECETRQVPMKQWVDIVSAEQQDCTYYLKDWHLVALLNQKTLPKPLYNCPEIFQFDILNPFLAEFTKGDYKFCYWGPKGSNTSRHSDVLHSFSWSYNVHGTKKWTFFGGEDWSQQFTVIQEAGQAIFVPSSLQHSVVNLEETISINHNWITVANIDKTFDCLLVELKAIHAELKGWGICETSDNFLEASESMLRGCVGLNISSFFLLLLWRLSQLLTTSTKELFCDIDEVDYAFECCNISRMIKIMMSDDKIQNLNLEGRVAATTMSEQLALEAMELATMAVGWVWEEERTHG